MHAEIRATNGGSSWSNPLQFHYTDDDSSTASADSELMERQLCLLQQFVQACCGTGAEASVNQLMASTQPQARSASNFCPRFLPTFLAAALMPFVAVCRRNDSLAPSSPSSSPVLAACSAAAERSTSSGRTSTAAP